MNQTTEKLGLVLEGGALRGLFSVGVMDVMMEADITFNGIVGVSAGAAFGCNYKSHQPKRALRYNQQFAKDRRYCGLWSWITTGNLFNAEFSYHIVPNEYDIFDNETFMKDPTEYHIVCTDITTGKPFYKRVTEGGDTLYEWIRASASMPVAARPVEMEGRLLLDGGMTDSIPLRYFQQQGFSKNIVILTQPPGYVKHTSRALPLIRLVYRRHPKVADAMAARPDMYNAQLKYVDKEVKRGTTLVIQPQTTLPIHHLSNDPDEMQQVYQMGRDAAMQQIDKIKAFCL